MYSFGAVVENCGRLNFCLPIKQNHFGKPRILEIILSNTYFKENIGIVQLARSVILFAICCYLIFGGVQDD